MPAPTKMTLQIINQSINQPQRKGWGVGRRGTKPKKNKPRNPTHPPAGKNTLELLCGLFELSEIDFIIERSLCLMRFSSLPASVQHFCLG